MHKILDARGQFLGQGYVHVIRSSGIVLIHVAGTRTPATLYAESRTRNEKPRDSHLSSEWEPEVALLNEVATTQEVDAVLPLRGEAAEVPHHEVEGALGRPDLGASSSKTGIFTCISSNISRSNNSFLWSCSHSPRSGVRSMRRLWSTWIFRLHRIRAKFM